MSYGSQAIKFHSFSGRKASTNLMQVVVFTFLKLQPRAPRVRKETRLSHNTQQSGGILPGKQVVVAQLLRFGLQNQPLLRPRKTSPGRERGKIVNNQQIDRYTHIHAQKEQCKRPVCFTLHFEANYQNAMKNATQQVQIKPETLVTSLGENFHRPEEP